MIFVMGIPIVLKRPACLQGPTRIKPADEWSQGYGVAILIYTDGILFLDANHIYTIFKRNTSQINS